MKLHISNIQGIQKTHLNVPGTLLLWGYLLYFFHRLSHKVFQRHGYIYTTLIKDKKTQISCLTCCSSIWNGSRTSGIYTSMKPLSLISRLCLHSCHSSTLEQYSWRLLDSVSWKAATSFRYLLTITSFLVNDWCCNFVLPSVKASQFQRCLTLVCSCRVVVTLITSSSVAEVQPEISSQERITPSSAGKSLFLSIFLYRGSWKAPLLGLPEILDSLHHRRRGQR